MLYHYEIGFPKVNLPDGVFKLRYSGHARKEARKETLELGLPNRLDTQEATLIEIETDNGVVIKGVYRQKYLGKKDLIIVVSMVEYPWVVKTVWMNRCDDKHSTLRKGRYVQP